MPWNCVARRVQFLDFCDSGPARTSFSQRRSFAQLFAATTRAHESEEKKTTAPALVLGRSTNFAVISVINAHVLMTEVVGAHADGRFCVEILHTAAVTASTP